MTNEIILTFILEVYKDVIDFFMDRYNITIEESQSICLSNPEIALQLLRAIFVRKLLW